MTELTPAIDLLMECASQFRFYQGTHEGKAMDTKRSEGERAEARNKAEVNKRYAERIETLLLANGAPHGWVAYGPDGEYHWSMAKPDNPVLEDPRPATSLERGILGLIGGSTAGTREFNDWKKAEAKKAAAIQDAEFVEIDHSGYVEVVEPLEHPGAEVGMPCPHDWRDADDLFNPHTRVSYQRCALCKEVR